MADNEASGPGAIPVRTRKRAPTPSDMARRLDGMTPLQVRAVVRLLSPLTRAVIVAVAA